MERIPGKGTFPRNRPNAEPNNAVPVPLPSVLAATKPSAPPTVRTVIAPVHAERSETPYVVISAVLNLPWEKDRPIEENWAQRVVLAAEHSLQKLGARTMVRNRFGVETEDIDPFFEYIIGSGANRILFVQGNIAEAERVALYENGVVALHHGIGRNPIPVVQVTTNSYGALPVPSITFDSELGSLIATRHLLDLGHRRILFAGARIDLPLGQGAWIVSRVRGFRRALQFAGLERSVRMHSVEEIMDTPNFVAGELGPEEGPTWTRIGRDVAPKVLRDPSITGVVAGNDTIAAEIIRAAREVGRRVPEDLSVVGFDNKLISTDLDLTTINVPFEQMAEEAVNAILEIDPRAENKALLSIKPMLVRRGSTCPPQG